MPCDQWWLKLEVNRHGQWKDTPYGKLKHIGSGRTRHVFAVDENWVLKVPQDVYAINNNEFEAFYCWTSQRFAKCILFSDGCLLMERVEVDMPYIESLHVSGSNDCGQIGRRRNGTYAAYDFS